MKKSLLIALLIAFAAACGSQQPAATVSPPTTIPTFAYLTPTPFAVIATALATETEQQQSSAVDPTAVALGANRYTALGCDTCHGAQGQGNGSQGPALVPMTLSEDDFITFLRTGGKLGNAHLFASNRLSDEGAHNLYLYVKSLGS